MVTTIGPALQRVALLVENLDRSLAFYQQIGFTSFWDRASRESDPGGVLGVGNMPLSATPKAGRIVVMKGEDPQLGLLGLLAYDNPPLAPARGELSGLGTGDFFLTIQVPNLQAVYSRLSEIGTRFHHAPVRYSMPGPDGGTLSGQSMFAYDPDGHLLELYQPD